MFFELIKQGKDATVFFSKLTWHSLRMFMMSLVYSCGWIADLTLFLMYERVHLCISLFVPSCYTELQSVFTLLVQQNRN